MKKIVAMAADAVPDVRAGWLKSEYVHRNGKGWRRRIRYYYG